jgi:hypothetical protein
MLGLILTSAPSAAFVATALKAAHADALKVIPAWGLPWTTATIREVAAMPRLLVVRTTWGDPSYAGGSRAMPEARRILDEVVPWLIARPGAIIEIGNEPLLSDHDDERAAWSYRWHLDQTITALRAAYPQARIIAPAHTRNHPIRLGAHADGQSRWDAICADQYRRCDALGLHAYSAEQLATGLHALRRDVSNILPVWVTEFALNAPLTPEERARRTRDLLRDAPIAGALLYHIAETPGDDPVHFNPNYRLDLATLQALGQEPPMTVNWVGMSRPHYEAGRTAPIRAVVIHATAGRHPSDLHWLRQGGDVNNPVSVHYYVDKRGTVSQLVRDTDTAWHAGQSRWDVDGKAINGLNATSIGIELENLNTGHDLYPEAQLAAAASLTRSLVEKYRIPQSQLVRHLDISPGRKTDPAGFDWPGFVARVYGDPWAAWGSAFPLPPEQRIYAIPQRWRTEGDLGAALGFEQALGPQRAAQAFERGVIVWLGGTRTEVVR